MAESLGQSIQVAAYQLFAPFQTKILLTVLKCSVTSCSQNDSVEARPDHIASIQEKDRMRTRTANKSDFP